MSAPSPSTGSTGASAAVLKIGGLDLAFRQSDIRALESASDMDGNAPLERSVGWIAYMRQRWPVYCLSEQLDVLDSVPPARRTCALLAFEAGYFGLLCDDAAILRQAAGQLHEVPPAMKHANTPILGLLPDGEHLLCLSNPGRMAAYLEHRTRRQSLPEELPCLP
ncbi:MAG: hypothetical protein Q7U91_08205 [Sideroxyarcus sp.]|nr:hypothetical protein [Sideroxyarcus sp.]